MRVPAAVFAGIDELLFRTELMVLPTDEENRLQHKYLDQYSMLKTLQDGNSFNFQYGKEFITYDYAIQTVMKILTKYFTFTTT